MVDGIGEELRFKSQAFTEAQSLATLALFVAIEEIAAIELQTHLVAPQLHLTTALRLGERGVPGVGLDIRLVDDPVMVVTLRILELLIISSDVFADAVFLAKIERSLFHARELAFGNQLIVDGGHITRVDL